LFDAAAKASGVRVAGRNRRSAAAAARIAGRADLGHAGSGSVWTLNGKRILVTVERH
jgi:hypothetical protein